MAVIREYRAKGPLTTIMLSVVALDDGLAIVATAAALALVSAPAVLRSGRICLTSHEQFSR